MYYELYSYFKEVSLSFGIHTHIMATNRLDFIIFFKMAIIKERWTQAIS